MKYKNPLLGAGAGAGLGGLYGYLTDEDLTSSMLMGGLAGGSAGYLKDVYDKSQTVEPKRQQVEQLLTEKEKGMPIQVRDLKLQQQRDKIQGIQSRKKRRSAQRAMRTKMDNFRNLKSDYEAAQKRIKTPFSQKGFTGSLGAGLLGAGIGGYLGGDALSAIGGGLLGAGVGAMGNDSQLNRQLRQLQKDERLIKRV